MVNFHPEPPKRNVFDLFGLLHLKTNCVCPLRNRIYRSTQHVTYLGKKSTISDNLSTEFNRSIEFYVWKNS